MVVRAAVILWLVAACSGGTAAPFDARADGEPCGFDCQCELSQCCRQGECAPATGPGICGRPSEGVCSPSGNCACVGGACDSENCCVMPDGAIDDGFGPACQP